jgi:hypothetical protein
MSALNANQKRRILHAFRDIHRRLDDIESAIAHANDSPFDRSVNDLSPEDVRYVLNSFARIREAMESCLRDSDIPIEVSPSNLRWTVQNKLMFVTVALEEIGPKQLRGYGPLPEAGRAEVLQIQDAVRSHIDAVTALLRRSRET